MVRIIIADNDPDYTDFMREEIREILSEAEIITTQQGDYVLSQVSGRKYDAAIIGYGLYGSSENRVYQELLEKDVETPIIVVTDQELASKDYSKDVLAYRMKDAQGAMQVIEDLQELLGC